MNRIRRFSESRSPLSATLDVDIEPARNTFLAPTALDRATQSQRFPLHPAIATTIDESIKALSGLLTVQIPPRYIDGTTSVSVRFPCRRFGRLDVVRTLMALGVQDDLFRGDNMASHRWKYVPGRCETPESSKRPCSASGMVIQKSICKSRSC
jgi:hypothetical protein